MGELCPKTFLAGQVALSPVCHVSRKPVTTPDHTVLWPRWALSLPGESWPGRGPQGDEPGSCLSYNWTRTFFFFFFTTKALKPQLEPTGCHRHSVPYEHLRGVSVDLYLCWQPARFTLTTYSVLTLLCLLLSMLLRSTLLLWCTLQNGWLWLFSLKVYIC